MNGIGRVIRAGRAIGLVALLASGACDQVELLPAEDARVSIEGEEERVQLVVSRDFVRIFDPDGDDRLEILAADTIWVEPPFDERWDIRVTRRFHVRALTSEPGEQSTTMRVWIDDEEQFRSTGDLAQGELAYTFVPDRQ